MNCLADQPKSPTQACRRGGSSRGEPVDDANGVSPVTPDELFAGSSMSEATWRGGPWDGVTMSVVAGERFFPVYGAMEAEGDETTRPVPPAQQVARPSRLCPIVSGPDGHLIIDWDAGIDH